MEHHYKGRHAPASNRDKGEAPSNLEGCLIIFNGSPTEERMSAQGFAA